jgi:hypothetical protein
MKIGKAKEQAEDLVVRLRELVGTLRELGPLREQETQREQLKVIGNSIQHLEKKGVPVPEDLRGLKSKLESEIQDAEKQQVVLYFLREQLSQVLAEIGATTRKGAPNGVVPTQGQ